MGMEETTPTVTEENNISDLESKVIRQIEYYFGDYNFGKDKFLKAECAKNEGWIPLEIMVKFNRLKQLTEDHSVIANALRKSPNQLLEVNEEGSQIRRNPLKPLPTFDANVKNDRDSRTIYAKGFKQDTTLDQLIDFFKKHGNAENILMRRNRVGTKKFKGSVFVTFKTLEEAQTFLEKEVEYKGTALLKEKKKDYLQRKRIEYEERQKLRQEKEQKQQESKPDDEDKEKSDGSKNEDVKFTKGCLLKLDGFPEDTLREMIKEFLEPHGTVSYIDYFKGQPGAVIRFESPIAEEIVEKLSKEGENGEKIIEMCNANLLATVIKDDDEFEYWASIKRKSAQNRNNKKAWQNKGGKGGRFGGKRFGGKGKWNKRKQNDDESEGNVPKKPKTENNKPENTSGEP